MIVFLFLGIIFEGVMVDAMLDFKITYFSSRCLFHGLDPYIPHNIDTVYFMDGFPNPKESAMDRHVINTLLYFPTCFPILAPLALLPWPFVVPVWIILQGGSYLYACYMIWRKAADHAPRLAGALAATLLAGSIWLIIVGNPAGVVISLSVFAVFALLEDRRPWLGIACLAVALVLKPQMPIMIWAYFLIASPLLRKRAIQSAVLAAVISLIGVAWVSHVAPNWRAEQKANFALTSTNGDLNDPSPLSANGDGPGSLIQLQTIVSIVKDDPHFYNPIVYAIFAVPLLLGVWSTVRQPNSSQQHWFALACIIPLSLIPVYHRSPDAGLIVLSFPACANLWVHRRKLGQIAAGVTFLQIFLCGDFWTLLRMVATKSAYDNSVGFMHQLLFILVRRPVPFSILALTGFYLYVYLRRSRLSFLADTSQPPATASAGA